MDNRTYIGADGKTYNDSLSGGVVSDPAPVSPNLSSLTSSKPAASPVSVISTNQAVTDLNKAKTTQSQITPVPVPVKGSDVLDASGKNVGTAQYDPNTGKPLSNLSQNTGTANANTAIDGTVGTPFSLADALTASNNNLTGWHKTSDGQWIPDATALSTLGIKGVSDTPEVKKAQEQATYYQQQRDSWTKELQNLDVSRDPALSAQLSALSGAWDARLNDMARVNASRVADITTTGTRLGSRYTGGAGGNVGGIIAEEERQGIQRLAELGSQKQSALISAQDAFRKNKFSEYVKFIDIADKAYTDQTTTLNTLVAKATENNKLVAKKIYDEVTKPIQDVSTDAAKNNAPKEVQDAISRAKTLSEAVQAAGEYLQTGTGIVGEYATYKRDATARGLPVLSFDDYQTRDANRKVSIAKAGNSATGLDNATLSKVEAQAGKFGNEPAVKNYQVSAEAIQALKTLGTSPTDDQSRIYAFAKVMDPNSVVRESEYATVQDYSQALFQKLGFKIARVFSNTGFLTDEARKMMEDTLDNRLKASEGAYKNIHDEYSRKINKITGKTDGNEYLTDYSKGFTSTGGDIIKNEEDAKSEVINFVETNAASNLPAVNTIKSLKQSGKSYSDILEYLKLQPYYKKP